jgi:hypothetical protein
LKNSPFYSAETSEESDEIAQVIDVQHYEYCLGACRESNPHLRWLN